MHKNNASQPKVNMVVEALLVYKTDFFFFLMKVVKILPNVSSNPAPVAVWKDFYNELAQYGKKSDKLELKKNKPPQNNMISQSDKRLHNSVNRWPQILTLYDDKLR